MQPLSKLIKEFGQFRVQQWANMGYQRYLKNQARKAKRQETTNLNQRASKILKSLPHDQLAKLKQRILSN